MSRHHETKVAVRQSLAMMNAVNVTPVSFVAVCSALRPGGYTVAEIRTAFDSLVRDRVVENLPGHRLRLQRQTTN